jgi:hypothetical protein
MKLCEEVGMDLPSIRSIGGNAPKRKKVTHA